ncbi:Two-component sensor histidine kinase, contains HisKA and HATPase domains [Roseomonas rosea]|uniref:Two-component sensor histidine kinase, contains HisKA and HATPase domains n=2 Tax=Muricoccus roseus TaxID=198092 RepID=A0A1M6MSF4_9PROT|nr:Two-component sensor histidine kinase, contains HisKA and HATPase domains [Roseomonas rosea]
MTYLSARSLHPAAPWSPLPRHGGQEAETISIGLLRHHTKNALQRILAEVSKVRGLEETRDGHRVMAELERRVMLSAALSNALFGLTHAPGGMEDRLRSVCEATVELMADPDQILRLEVVVEGECPAALRGTVLRAAHEMVGNAVKHGMHARLLGHIRIRLTSDAAWTGLAVEDDGWGYAGARDGGEGLGLLRALAALHEGTTTLQRIQDGTRATMDLPHGPQPLPMG